MKNLSTLVRRILGSAFLISYTLSAFAQPDEPAKTKVWSDEGIVRSQLKQQGIPDAAIEKIIAEDRELYKQGRKIVVPQQQAKIFGQNPVVHASCSDMGGETGWGSWVATPGDYLGGVVTLGSPMASPAAPRFNLTSGPGIDACTPGLNPGDPPIPVVAPGFGNASIQIGQIQTNGSLGGCSWGCVEQLTYPLTVTANDTNFTFAYAMVMEDPAHSASDQPFVSLCIMDSNGNPLPCGCFTYTSGPSLPGFYTSKCNINSVSYYKPWTLVGINLGPYIGQTLTVQVRNADCGQGGHFAQSYWDFNCGTLSSIAQFCVGEDSVLLTAPNDVGFTYSWSTGQTTSSIIANPQPPNPDTITVHIFPPSGCGFYEVYVLAPTIINPAFTYTINCNKVSFSDNSSITGGTISGYNWSFPGGTPSSSTSQNPGPISYPSAGTYSASVIVTSQAGCIDTSSTITFTLQPPPVISATNASICGGNTGTLCASGATTYVWSPTNQSTTCITVTTASPSSYTVIGTDANGCTGTTTAAVSVGGLPNISAGPNQSVCIPGCVTLNATGAGSGGTYAWSPATGLSNPNIANPVACPSSATVYTVIGTDANKCSNTSNVSVGINPKPNVTAAPNSSICIGQSSATITGNGASTYSWVPTTGLSCASCASTVANPPFSNTYTVIGTSANGCTNTATVSVDVGSIPFVSAIAPTTICNGDSAVLNANTSNGQPPYSYGWNPPNSLNNPSLQNPTTGAATTTTFVVTVTDSYGCHDDTSTVVYVQTIPSITWAKWDPALTCDGIVIPLKTNVSSNGQSVYWSFGDGTSTTITNPSYPAPYNFNPPPHTYPYGSIYNIQVIVYNNPCADTLDTAMAVNDVTKYINLMPANVFTPNGDNKNDCFHPAVCDLAAVVAGTPCPQDTLTENLKMCLEFEVYDRWGIKMFETTDTEKCWDGKTKGGSPAKEGTYYYIAKFGENVNIRGFVELLR